MADSDLMKMWPLATTFLAVVIIPLIVAVINLKAKEKENSASPYAAIASRVLHLEGQSEKQDLEIEQLQEEQAVDRAYIRHLLRNWPSDSTPPSPPPPPPEWLRSKIAKGFGI